MEYPIENSSLGATEEELCPLCTNTPVSDGRCEMLHCCWMYACAECLRSYIEYRIEDGQYLFPCPMPGCPQKLTDELVNQFISLTQKNKIALLKLNADNSPTKRSCPNCSHITSISEQNYQLMKKAKSSTKSSTKVNQMLCSTCYKPWCYFCYGPTHAGISCKDNLDENNQFNQWTKDWDGVNHQQNAFRCPRCQVPTQRDGGCPSMNCIKCSCYWCYNCGKETSKSNTLLGGHGGDKWEVNACDRYTILGSKKVTKRLRWFKVVQEIVIFTICGVAILTICVPLLPALIFIVPPVIFLFYAAKSF
ncbi:E3 ubiquitin-protein ligase [Oopsacas minuta]|uniref:RBR-type E3 ubiquitin transferase n=1 Tax=Oopsacas minuta TaxID=111878 RepID=A0AAV7KDI1_9METZ|nr:E3 ubiquitin-protein ligase [Oopsacas minuta]